MDKNQVEEKFRRLEAVPIVREKVGNYDLYIAEGHSKPPHFKAQKLGIKPDEFPFGMFTTWFWWGKGEKLWFGSPSFYCALNTTSDRRLNDVKARAQMDLLRMLKAKQERGISN